MCSGKSIGLRGHPGGVSGGFCMDLVIDCEHTFSLLEVSPTRKIKEGGGFDESFSSSS